jgi:hypothetical protein
MVWGLEGEFSSLGGEAAFGRVAALYLALLLGPPLDMLMFVCYVLTV